MDILVGTQMIAKGWLGTTRGIVGFAPDSLPRTLFFATGGVAYGQVKTSFSGSVAGNFLPANCEGPCAFTGRLAFNDAQTKVGWTLGAGIEAALGTNPKWSWKIEYLYVDLGTVGGAVPVSGTVCTNSGGFGCAAFSGTANYSNRMTDNIVRFGVNYRFGP